MEAEAGGRERIQAQSRVEDGAVGRGGQGGDVERRGHVV